MILSCSNINKTFTDNHVIKNASFHIEDNEKAAIVGINGAGKTTLLKIIVGSLSADHGTVTFAKDKNYGYLAQHQAVDSENTIFDELLTVKQEVLDLEASIRQTEQEMKSASDSKLELLLKKYDNLMHRFETINGYAYKSEITGILKGLGFTEEDFAKKVETLSGGQKTRIALGKILLQKPDLIILDEPTNHLDLNSIAWLETYLLNYKGAVIIVSHDRYFLDNVAGWILELDRGKGIPWKGNYSSWLEQKEKRLALEERSDKERQKTLARELEWIRMAPKGRHAKSKARINAYEAMVSHESERLAADLEIYIPPGPRLGNTVIQAENISKAMGDKVLMENMNFIIQPGAIVGIIGPNGAGKSTLFKMIAGQERPDKGGMKIGDTVKLAYVDQGRDSLQAGKSVYDIISEGAEFIKLGSRDINAARTVPVSISMAATSKRCQPFIRRGKRTPAFSPNA